LLSCSETYAETLDIREPLYGDYPGVVVFILDLIAQVRVLKVPWGTRDFLKVPWGTRDFLKVPWGTRDFLKVPWGTRDFLKVPRGTRDFLKVPRGTRDFLKVPLFKGDLGGSFMCSIILFTQ